MNLNTYVLYHARMSPHRPAIAYTGGVATYGMVADAIHAAARRIGELGLEAQMLVAIDVRNPFQHLVLILALERCGITSVSLHTVYSAVVSGLVPDAVILDRFGTPLVDVRTIALDDAWFARDRAAAPSELRPVAADRHTRIVLSSGTTGVPKAVGLTPAVLERRMLDGVVWANGAGRTLSVAGVSTVGSFHLFHALISGGLACFAPNPEETLHLVRLFGVGHLIALPGQLRDIVDHQLGGFEACPTLHRVTVGGSRISKELITDARATLSSDVMLAYGTTETGGIAYGLAGTFGDVEGAAGYLAPWARAQAVDEDGAVLPAGRQGQLRLWTNKVGEFVAPEPRDRAILGGDGWFRPGDVGAVHGDGLVAVVGKSIEVINRDGAIVSPHLVEDALKRHDEVVDAGVIEMRTDAARVEIWAGVVARGPLDEHALLSRCAGLLGDKAPDVLVRIDAVPRTDTGKIIRGELRQAVLRRYAERTAGAAVPDGRPGVAR